MLTKRNAGLTEFIPTPQEKRDGLIRDHTLHLLQNLHQRLELIEHSLDLSARLADEFRRVLQEIAREEAAAHRAHEQGPARA